METALKRTVSWDEAAASAVTAFGTVLGLNLQPGNLTPDEKNRTEELVRVKYGHLSWTEK